MFCGFLRKKLQSRETNLPKQLGRCSKVAEFKYIYMDFGILKISQNSIFSKSKNKKKCFPFKRIKKKKKLFKFKFKKKINIFINFFSQNPKIFFTFRLTKSLVWFTFNLAPRTSTNFFWIIAYFFFFLLFYEKWKRDSNQMLERK